MLLRTGASSPSMCRASLAPTRPLLCAARPPALSRGVSVSVHAAKGFGFGLKAKPKDLSK